MPYPSSYRSSQRHPIATAAVAAAGLFAAWQGQKLLRAQWAKAKTSTDMARVLAKLAELGARPVETLSVDEARRQPMPADAVTALAGRRPSDGVSARDLQIDGAAGPLPARVYTPAEATDGQRRPLIVYWHGGGWVIADLDTYDASARALARETDAIVLSCHYRQAPEHKFPAAHEDALAAYRWATNHAEELGADPARIAVAGESAGGNLAANVALMARDQGLPMPVHQLLIYPIASANLSSPSYLQNAYAKPLSKAGVKWFVAHALASKAQAKDERIDLVNRDDLMGAPPATIINADIDPLRWDGEALAEALDTADVPMHQATYPGVTHEFFGMDAVVARARDAQALAGRELRRAFGLEQDLRPDRQAGSAMARESGVMRP